MYSYWWSKRGPREGNSENALPEIFLSELNTYQDYFKTLILAKEKMCLVWKIGAKHQSCYPFFISKEKEIVKSSSLYNICRKLSNLLLFFPENRYFQTLSTYNIMIT